MLSRLQILALLCAAACGLAFFAAAHSGPQPRPTTTAPGAPTARPTPPPVRPTTRPVPVAATAPEAKRDVRMPGGSLQALDEKGQPRGACPLKLTDVRVSISGFVARVELTQQFHNPFAEKIEAVYTFPLSQSGAVDDMTMRVGERVIRGQIKRREDARRIYEDARAAGHVASLLDQERPNIFTQSVANILPGESVDVNLRYVETLSYDEGVYRFAFPMVVGPRFIPGQPTGQTGTGWAPDTGQVPDASRITPPVTPEGTRAGHDVSLAVDLDAGFALEEIRSELHEVKVERIGSARARIALVDKATIPNKDFILTYRTAGNDIADAVLTHAGPQGKFLTLILQPPRRVTPERVSPKEMVFVIDSSGSMSGWPIEKAKETMKVCIQRMNPDDTFNLATFSNKVESCFQGPMPNTPENRERALRFLGERVGSGGTQMLPAIEAALLPPPDPKRVRIVCFMTDGYVGNDMEIIHRVQENVGTARFFSFGVGNSVNAFLLDKMGELGRGEVEYVTLEQPGSEAARRFHQRIANPVLTDISVDWGSLAVADVLPAVIPDLFAAKPVVIKARYTKPGSGVITLRGKVAGKPYQRRIRVDLPDSQPGHEVLAPIWARARVDDLMNRDWLGAQRGSPDPAIKDQVTGLGLDFRLMTQYTSFVAVEEMVVTEGGKPRTIAVPVEMPEGVSYEGVFGESAKRLGQMSGGMNLGLVLRRQPDRNGGGTFGGGGFGGGMAPQQPRFTPASPTAGVALAPAPAMPGKAPAPAGALRAEAFADAAASPAREQPALTPEQQREQTLKARLDPLLRELPALLAREGKEGNLKTERLEVRDGRVEVAVWLTDTSEATLARLKALGFELTLQARAVKMVVGRVAVEKLEALALLEGVRRVEPPAYK